MTEKYTLTAEGLEALKKELADLLNNERPLVLKEIEEARSYGDLSENSDYDAARTKQGKIESEILRLEYIIANCQIVEFAKSSNVVSIGNYVKLQDNTNDETFVVRIVGQFEGQQLSSVVTLESPLAIAIAGKKVGQKVLVKAPVPYEVEILQISVEPIK